MEQQILKRDGARRIIDIVERRAWTTQNLPIGKFGQEFIDRIPQAKFTLLHQHQRGDTDDRLGHRGNPEQRVAPHRRLRLGILPAQYVGMHRLAMAMNQGDHPGDGPGIDMRLHRRRDPPQPLARKTRRSRHALPQFAKMPLLLVR